MSTKTVSIRTRTVGQSFATVGQIVARNGRVIAETSPRPFGFVAEAKRDAARLAASNGWTVAVRA